MTCQWLVAEMGLRIQVLARACIRDITLSPSSRRQKGHKLQSQHLWSAYYMPEPALNLFHVLFTSFLDSIMRLVLFYSHFTEEEMEAGSQLGEWSWRGGRHEASAEFELLLVTIRGTKGTSKGHMAVFMKANLGSRITAYEHVLTMQRCAVSPAHVSHPGVGPALLTCLPPQLIPKPYLSLADLSLSLPKAQALWCYGVGRLWGPPVSKDGWANGVFGLFDGSCKETRHRRREFQVLLRHLVPVTNISLQLFRARKGGRILGS